MFDLGYQIFAKFAVHRLGAMSFEDVLPGVWKDANDSRVEIIQQKQSEALFAEGGSMLYSSDAYFLLHLARSMEVLLWNNLVGSEFRVENT